MKLHLNLTLRRAVLAAMAMVAIHVAQAETTSYNGADAYISGEGTIESNEWNAIWNKNKAGSLTVGTYKGAADVSLSGKSTYNKGQIIFIGGTGNNSGQATANSGVLNVGAATLNVDSAVYVGNSQKVVTGNLLTIDGGTLNSGNALYVGAWAASGDIAATNATIKVNSGKTGAVFAMGWRETSQGGSDTVTLSNSTITVGAVGGVKDISTIGRGGSVDVLDLTNGSKATFHDQTIVGEKAGSDGAIYVRGGSTLNLGTGTVLGNESGAKGAIYVEGGTAVADNLIAGAAGKADLMVADGSLTANYITLAEKAGSTAHAEFISGTVKAGLLTIGDAGSGSVVNTGKLSATDMVIGNTETGVGSLYSSGTTTVAEDLYVGYKGTGSVDVQAGSLSAANAYVVGQGSILATEGGSTAVTNATVLAGKLSTGFYGTTTVGNELILAEGASLVNEGITSVEKAVVATGSSIQANTGTLNTNTLVNGGTIVNDGIWNTGASATSTAGTIANGGNMNVSGSLSTSQVTGSGTVNVAKSGKWTIIGQTEQGSIINDGAITLQGAGRMEAGSLAGSGVTTIEVNESRVSTPAGEAVIELGNAVAVPGNIKVAVDIAKPDALVGKKVDFLKDTTTGELVAIGVDNISLTNADKNDVIVWADNCIQLSETKRENQSVDADGNKITTETIIRDKVDFVQSAGSTVGASSGMFFTRHELSESTAVTDIEWAKNVAVEIEVKTETVVTNTEDVSNATVEEVVIEIPEDAEEDKKAEIIAANEANKAAAEIVTQAEVVQKAEITTGVDDKGEDVKGKVVVGKDVKTSDDSTGTVKVQSVVVNQHTTITKESETGQEVTKKSETIGTSGLSIVFEGETKHEGSTDADGNKTGVIGFAKDTVTGTTKVEGEEVTVQKVDIVQVKESANVTIVNLDMHATHALTIGDAAENMGKATLVLDNVDFHVGGETDVNVLHMVEVNVYDENGKVTGTVLKPVESDNHLTTKTTITNAEVQLIGSSVLKFEELDFGTTDEKLAAAGLSREEIDKLHGTTTISNCDIVLTGGNAQLGETDYKDETGKEHKYQEVVIENSNIKGSGHIKKAKMKGGKLTVGSSPGQLKLTEFVAENKTQLEFFIIADTSRWNATGMNSNTDYATGSISQLVVDKSVTLNNINPDVVITFQTWNGTDYVNVAANSTEVLTLGSYLQEGAEIKFIDGNLSELTIIGETPVLSESALPQLDASEGLFWDISTLFTDGVVRVMAEVLEEPYRVANSLVSAGETVLNFGRVAGAQAQLREAGSTRTWASALAMFDSIDGGNTTNGYDYNAWGAAVGVDHAFAKNTVIGVAFGCSWGENEAEEGNGYYEAGTIDQDAKMVALYGTHKFRTKGLLNDVKLNAFAAYGWFENDSTRTAIKSGNEAAAEWDSNAYVLSASLSRDITTDEGLVVSPYVGVEYTKAGMDDFAEDGKSYSADYTADQDYSNLAVKVGVNVSQSFGSFTPYAGIAYINDVSRDAAKVTASGKRTIEGKSALPGRDALQLKVGANWQITETMDLNAGYTAELRSKATEQSANVGIGITF